MPFKTKEGIRYYQFEKLGDGIVQAVFTRLGGVSPEPWASMNMGGTVGDDPMRVQRNKQLALAALEREVESVYDVWQVHGTNVVIVDSPRERDTPYLQADAILTNKPGVTLMMRFADCVPIFLYDPFLKVVGIVHAGWEGTVRGTAAVAVENMRDSFGSDPLDIRAAIGPSIGPDHYEVGIDVVSEVNQAFGKDASYLLEERSGSIYLDLWMANRLVLERVGIQNIEIAGLCTACHNQDWYSHRAEHGRTGRFGAVIALNP